MKMTLKSSPIEKNGRFYFPSDVTALEVNGVRQLYFTCKDMNQHMGRGSFVIVTVKDDPRIKYLHKVIVMFPNEVFCEGDLKFNKNFYDCDIIVASTDDTVCAHAPSSEFLAVCGYYGDFSDNFGNQPVKQVLIEVVKRVVEPEAFILKAKNKIVSISKVEKTKTDLEVNQLLSESERKNRIELAEQHKQTRYAAIDKMLEIRTRYGDNDILDSFCKDVEKALMNLKQPN